LFLVASQYANLFHFICSSSKDLSTTRFRSNSASANPRNLRLSLLRAFGALWQYSLFWWGSAHLVIPVKRRGASPDP
jgi:hypothetical protein